MDRRGESPGRSAGELKAGAEVLCYWYPGLLEGALPRRQAHRYLTFDTDQGGLNNIRLVFEYAAVIAAITGRSLVLPPAQTWYLINRGPKHRGDKSGVTDFADIFEIAALKSAIPVLTTAEFVVEAAGHLDIPDRFRQPGYFDKTADPEPARQWKQWLAGNARVLENWNPYQTLICFPEIADVDLGSLPQNYVDGRHPIELTPRSNAAPLLHLPSDDRYRSLGPVSTMLAGPDESLPRLGRRLIKHHVRYRNEIFEIGSRLISLLGPYEYDALHIRRNDFQYKQTRNPAATILENVRPVLCDDLPIYVATDETDEKFLEVLRERRAVFLDDLLARVPDLTLPEGWIGPVEQVICAGARRFIGTDLSTFSSYIVRLRGYSRAPDMASYFHGERCEPEPEPGYDDFRGREYLRENPLFWLDC